jgi:hypothetical protein
MDVSKIEILVVRDPDADTETTVWVDGVLADVSVWDIDPGKGCYRNDWLSQQVVLLAGDGSEAFKAAAMQTYEAYDDSQYIEDDGSKGVEVGCWYREEPWPAPACSWVGTFSDVEAAAEALRAHRATHPAQ